MTYETRVVPEAETNKEENYININESLSQKLSWIGDDNQLSTDSQFNPPGNANLI